MAASPTLAEEARSFFASDALPQSLSWFELLSPLHQRLFAVELNAALASPSPELEPLQSLLESWQATADMDASPELRAAIDANRQRGFVPAE